MSQVFIEHPVYVCMITYVVHNQTVDVGSVVNGY